MSLKSYKFRIGSDALITYGLESSNSYSVVFEIFTLNAEHPFYTNEELHPTALLPEQRGRFEVRSSHNGSNFTVLLTIHNIKKIDEGVYILIAQERNGKTIEHILDANVEVIIPPGKAECSARNTNYSPKLRQVVCQATAGSDEGASLMCYQNSEKAPTFGPITHSLTHIKGVFWMNIEFPINCCSLESNSVQLPNSCDDFKYDTSIQHATKVPDKKVTIQDIEDIIPTVPWSKESTPKKSEEDEAKKKLYSTSIK